METVYIGSANLTGAAFGMKSERNRNFEAGIFTDEMNLVEEAINQFDEIWIGKFCENCGRKDVCKDRIVWNIIVQHHNASGEILVRYFYVQIDKTLITSPQILICDNKQILNYAYRLN